MPEVLLTDQVQVQKQAAPKLKRKKARKLLAQWRRKPSISESAPSSHVAVAELFSPPRFKLEAERHGLKGFSFDLSQGWDLLDYRV